jgi:hypothetical protein
MRKPPSFRHFGVNDKSNWRQSSAEKEGCLQIEKEQI